MLFSLLIEVEKFKKIMILNGYREKFFDRIVRSFFKKIFEKPSSTSEPKPKRIFLFMLPFSGAHSSQIRNQINKLFSSAYPHIQIRCIFRPMQRLSSAFFRFKDRIFLNLSSPIVYKYKCQCYNALYVGESVRHFHKHISEHMGISASNGKPLSKPPFSNIRDHHQASGDLVILSLLMISPFSPLVLHPLNTSMNISLCIKLLHIL